MLDAAYITECEHRARRFSGAYTGTSGSLAADSMRLLNERAELLTTIETLTSANQALRDAVTARLAGCQPAHEAALRTFNESTSDSVADEQDEPPKQVSIPHDWILQGQRELEAHKDDVRYKGDSVMYDGTLRPGSREFLAVLDEIKSLHLKKTLDYGVDDDALSNIRTSADIVNMPAWAGCILRISDKMHRLKSFFRRGRVEFDGIPDTLLDICCYSAIALVLYREGQATDPA